MGRRSMKLCLLCRYSGGDVPAVAKYYIPKNFVCDDGKHPSQTGWIPVCDYCASLVKRYNPQFELEYYDKNFVADYGPYNHRWGPKINLVSNPDCTDTYECEKCHKRINAIIWNRSDYGCPVKDKEEE